MQVQRPDGHFYAVYHPVCIKVKGLLNLTSLCSGMLQLGLLDPPTSGGDLEEVIHEIDSFCIEESTGKIHTMFSVKILYFSCFYVKWWCRPEFWLMKSILGAGSVETSTALFQRSPASPNVGILRALSSSFALSWGLLWRGFSASRSLDLSLQPTYLDFQKWPNPTLI